MTEENNQDINKKLSARLEWLERATLEQYRLIDEIIYYLRDRYDDFPMHLIRRTSEK